MSAAEATRADVAVPLLLDATRAAKFIGLSRTEFHEQDVRGEIPAPADTRAGKRRRWSSEELRAWVQHGCPSRTRWEAIRATARRSA